MKNKKVYIKGFDKDLKCREYQFEIGKEYKIENNGKELELCTNTVFHFCDGLQKVHGFYNCNEETNRYCIIEVLGGLIEDEEKSGSDHIKIVRELTEVELKLAKGLTNGNTGLFNSGDRNSGDSNSGYWNSGNRNSGDSNSGDWNSGDSNSGDWNSGDWNSGVFNKTNNSNGVFCNIEPKICIFNIQTDWTLKEFYNSKYWNAICSSYFDLTEWVNDEKLSESGTGGKLIVNSYEDACRKWWANMSKENKEIIKSMPNFNVKVFCDITGIDKEEV